MGKKLRDTIHGYIYLTRLEEAVSQHPLVLRLHYVHQTSFTYLTYVNAHSTRYPHSLGVMHVAGEIFQSALVNTADPVLTRMALQVRNFLGKEMLSALADELIKNEAGRGRELIYESLRLGTTARASGSAGFTLSPQADLYLPLLVLFQATRLAAMLHDIGHPPFSHIVEYALLQGRPAYGGHEPIGYELVDLIAGDDSLKNRSGYSEAPIFASKCLELCRHILRSDASSQFYGLKRSLISGPLDADRLDYVRRDAYAAGLVPRYDIRRLVDAAFFRTCENGFEVGYRPNCLSAVENFFQARYDLYRYMIYHHDVARRNLAIQRLMATVFAHREDLPADIIIELDDLTAHAEGRTSRKYFAYEYFTDSYFLNFLWKMDASLRDNGDSAVRTRIRLYLNVVLRRRNDLMRTLLKRPDDYARFANKVVGKLHDLGRLTQPAELDLNSPVPLLNQLLRDRLGTHPKGSAESVAKIELAEKLERAFDAAAVSDMPNAGMKFQCYYFGTFAAGPEGKISFSEPDDARQILAEEISPSLAMLAQAWSYSPQLSVFFHMPDGGSSASARTQRSMYEQYAVEGMVHFLSET